MIVLEFDEIPPGLNSRFGQTRMHWAEYREKKNYWAALVLVEILGRRPSQPVGKCVVIYTLKTVRSWDWDNLVATFKFIGDGLINAGILIDDSPSVIKSLVTFRKRVEHFKDEGCVVEIIPDPPENFEEKHEKWLRSVLVDTSVSATE